MTAKAQVAAAIALFAVFGSAHGAAAQCVTKPATIAPALNGKDAYAMAKAEATKWKADSAFVAMMTTMGGPMVKVTSETIFDTKQLYDAAQAGGGSAHDPKTVAVVVSLRVSPSKGDVWIYRYTTPQGRPLSEIELESKTGRVAK